MHQHYDGDEERLVSRTELAQILTEAGFPIAPQTLAKYACIGGGPEFQMFGRLPRYSVRKGIEWAKGRLSKPVKCRAELQRTSTSTAA